MLHREITVLDYCLYRRLDKSIESVTGGDRERAKRVVYAIVYGVGKGTNVCYFSTGFYKGYKDGPKFISRKLPKSHLKYICIRIANRLLPCVQVRKSWRKYWA